VAALKGEVLGVSRYSPPKGKGVPRVSVGSDADNLYATAFPAYSSWVAQADGQPWQDAFEGTIGNAVENLDSNFGVADFPETDQPDAEDICAAKAPITFTTTRSAVTAVEPIAANFELDEGDPADPEDDEWVPTDTATETTLSPASSVTYTFNNAKWYTTARSPGITFTSDVNYKQVRDGVTCEATYKAVGLWPAVHCSAPVDCDPCADPLHGRPTGSGINPDLKTTCDTDLGLCVLAGDSLPGFYTDDEIRTRSEECKARTETGTAQ
jgi:hypothetical protein